ncbi:cyclic AMP-dependent transcription factor ATF-1-like isoform X5 [Tachysurus fulvidraco]|nr:cyclic AMP-dependent transcription factor ATF-1-like isoform X5 [Tachysurus fulvidraco]
MSLAPAEMLSTEQAAPPSVQAPNFFITNRSHMYAFMPNGGTQISSSKQNDPSFKIPTSRAAQPGPSFVNFHVPVVHGTRHYAPGSKRNAAKECRRRKREYINYLEVHASILEQQNKKLMEELNYLKGICEQKPSAVPPYSSSPNPYPAAVYPIRSSYPQQNPYALVKGFGHTVHTGYPSVNTCRCAY